MFNDFPDSLEFAYRCSRCGGMFGSNETHTIHCPFCGMLCEETSCKIMDLDNK
ncbi:MAG: hypothetical protein H6Q74_3026 [Firmicutes bacterium]|nr:hypothetical protein [Bacillota bacterium]